MVGFVERAGFAKAHWYMCTRFSSASTLLIIRWCVFCFFWCTLLLLVFAPADVISAAAFAAAATYCWSCSLFLVLFVLILGKTTLSSTRYARVYIIGAAVVSDGSYPNEILYMRVYRI